MQVACTLGGVAVALNGVAIFSGAVDTNCGQLEVADETAEWTSFDCCTGHAERTGAYHYHFARRGVGLVFVGGADAAAAGSR